MNKSDQKKIKPFDDLSKRIIEAHELYDDPSPVVHDPMTNTFKTENQLKKEISDQEKYKILKDVSNQQERKEFRDIERKYKKEVPFKKNKLISQRKLTKQTNHKPQVPLKIDFDFQIPKKIIPKKDQTLANLEKERTRIDPDYFKGLGTFLLKKI